MIRIVYRGEQTSVGMIVFEMSEQDDGEGGCLDLHLMESSMKGEFAVALLARMSIVV